MTEIKLKELDTLFEELDAKFTESLDNETVFSTDGSCAYDGSYYDPQGWHRIP